MFEVHPAAETEKGEYHWEMKGYEMNDDAIFEFAFILTLVVGVLIVVIIIAPILMFTGGW